MNRRNHIQNIVRILEALGVPNVPSVSATAAAAAADENEQLQQQQQQQQQQEKENRIIEMMELWLGIRENVNNNNSDYIIIDDAYDGDDDWTSRMNISSFSNSDSIKNNDHVITTILTYVIDAWNNVDTYNNDDDDDGDADHHERTVTTGAASTTTMMMMNTNWNTNYSGYNNGNGSTLYVNLLQTLSSLQLPIDETIAATTTTTKLSLSKMYQQQKPSSCRRRLDSSLECFRATTYLRTIMEQYNDNDEDDPANDDDDDNNNTTTSTTTTTNTTTATAFCRRLVQFWQQQQQQQGWTVVVSKHQMTTFLQALFQHIQSLSQYYQQILSIMTTLSGTAASVQFQHQQQQQQSSSKVAQEQQQQRYPVDPHTMLTSVTVGSFASVVPNTTTATSIAIQQQQTLHDEFQQHLRDIEYILGDLYDAAATASAATDTTTTTVTSVTSSSTKSQGISLNMRCYIRQLLGQYWLNYIRIEKFTGSGTGGTTNSKQQENTNAVAMKLTLSVLRRILLGMSVSATTAPNTTTSTSITFVSSSVTSYTNVHVMKHLLDTILLPLHEMNTIVLWRDQISTLQQYHEALCQCIVLIIQKVRHIPTTSSTSSSSSSSKNSIIYEIITKLLQPNVFPIMGGNTSKIVLLLHEIDIYIQLLVPASESVVPVSSPASGMNYHDDTTNNGTSDNKVVHDDTEERLMLQLLCTTLGRCMSSEHSRIAERALQYFQSNTMDIFFTDFNHPNPPSQRSQNNLTICLRTLLPFLIRTEPSWNPTVRKMTYHVVQKLSSYNENIFVTICNELFTASKVATTIPSNNLPLSSSGTTTSKLFSSLAATNSSTHVEATSTSLQAGMGNWRPPTSSSLGTSIGSNPNHFPVPTKQPPATVTGVAPWAIQPKQASLSQQQPPLTVTGVAPWAIQQQHHHQRLPKRIPTSSTQRTVTVHDSNISNHSNSDSANQGTVHFTTGYDYVLANLAKIKPPVEEEGASSWSRTQMAETPTLLPNLKFHDLVFGHELGSGAFGSVKYARHIDRTKTRSYWAEYAVKVVSTERIREMGYEPSIQREIAVLHVLSHPGIARLISSFRFNDGAYLVLEYASRGDLHTLLHKHGSLDIESTRFVIGEIIATLSSIHDCGFIYGDLKPENVVITEPGHIKLTDFGGCRPVTEDAKRLVGSIAKDILKNLRDGDWKDTPQGEKTSDDGFDEIDASDKNESGDDDEWVDDVRIEGTTAYLPPEVVMGNFPTFAADAWALGCVMYQCLTGRPPLLEADDGATRKRIVTFDSDRNLSDVDQLFIDKHAAGITTDARDMIKILLDRDPSKRPSMLQLSEHAFFSSSNVYTLHSQPPYPLDVGPVGPTPNEKWSRRQFSTIWAPQPEAYNVFFPTSSPGKKAGSSGRMTDRPIIERDEIHGFFSATGKMTHSDLTQGTGKRNRRIMLPPSFE